ncbi:sperm acrosome membrane-associated protein 4-like [Brachionichthys hirsutus]|uniref:sperm acrosome membrane-associated protein 4-like n=1 Tax=Brachionichthys hirsutus TaxID=412623 RepID=UPI003604B8ED
MNRIILSVFAVGFCFAIGQALQCYKCDIGLFNLCITSEVTCESGEQCFSGAGEAAGIFSITRKGCLAVADCNKTSEVTVPGDSNATIFNIFNTCCNTNLCNAAPGLPGTSSLALALATIAALMVNILV